MSTTYRLLLVLALISGAFCEETEKTKAIIINIDDSAPEKSRAVIADLSEGEQGESKNYLPPPHSSSAEYTPPQSRIILDKDVGYVLIRPEDARKLHLDSSAEHPPRSAPRYVLIRQTNGDEDYRNSTVPQYFYRTSHPSNSEGSSARDPQGYDSYPNEPPQHHSLRESKYPSRIGPPPPSPGDGSESAGRNHPPYPSGHPTSSEIEHHKSNDIVKPSSPRSPFAPRAPLLPRPVGFLHNGLTNSLFGKPSLGQTFTTPPYAGFRYHTQLPGFGLNTKFENPFADFGRFRDTFAGPSFRSNGHGQGFFSGPNSLDEHFRKLYNLNDNKFSELPHFNGPNKLTSSQGSNSPDTQGKTVESNDYRNSPRENPNDYESQPISYAKDHPPISSNPGRYSNLPPPQQGSRYGNRISVPLKYRSLPYNNGPPNAPNSYSHDHSSENHGYDGPSQSIPGQYNGPSSYGGPPPSGPNSYGAPPPSGPSSYRGPPPSGPSSYSGPPPSGPSSYGGPPPSGPSSYGGPPPSGPSSYSGPSPSGPSSYANSQPNEPSSYDAPPSSGPHSYSHSPPSVSSSYNDLPASGPTSYSHSPPSVSNSYTDPNSPPTSYYSGPSSSSHSTYDDHSPPNHSSYSDLAPPSSSGYSSGGGPSPYSAPDPLRPPKTVASYSYSNSDGIGPQSYSSHSSPSDGPGYPKTYDSSYESPADYPKTMYNSYNGQGQSYFTEDDAIPDSPAKYEPIRQQVPREPDQYKNNHPRDSSSEVPDYHKAKMNYEPVRPPPKSSLRANKLHPPLPPPRSHSGEVDDSSHKNENRQIIPYGPAPSPPRPMPYHDTHPQTHPQPNYGRNYIPNTYSISSLSTPGYGPGYRYEKTFHPYTTEPNYYQSRPHSSSEEHHLDDMPRYYKAQNDESSEEQPYNHNRSPDNKPSTFDRGYKVGIPSHATRSPQGSELLPPKVSSDVKPPKLRKRPRLKLLPKLQKSRKSYSLKPHEAENYDHTRAPKKVYRTSARHISKDAVTNYADSEDDSNAAIPGEPGRDYPVLNSIPQTDFTCYNKPPGFYADVDNRCQVYFQCSETGKVQSFLCPNGTLFNQETFVCEWWHNVDCSNSEKHFARNNELYKVPEELQKHDRKAVEERHRDGRYQPRVPPKLRYRVIPPEARQLYQHGQTQPDRGQQHYDIDYQQSRRSEKIEQKPSTTKRSEEKAKSGKSGTSS